MKEGLVCILLDVDNDDPIDLIEVEFGLKGFGVIVKLWQKIAKDHGYYTDFSEDVAMLFARKINVSNTLMSEILKAAFKRGIFDEGLYKKYSIITSKDRQEKFFVGARRWKKINLIKEYLLVSVDQIPQNAYIVSKNVDIFEENVYISETIKGNEMKGNEMNSNSKGKSALASSPSAAIIHKYEELISKNKKATATVIDGINEFLSKGMEEALVIRLIEYAREQEKPSWSYVKAAINGNLKDGILTLDAYNRHQAERAERSTNNKASERIVKRSKFNNYEDSNKKDYSKMQEEILKGFME